MNLMIIHYFTLHDEFICKFQSIQCDLEENANIRKFIRHIKLIYYSN